MPAKAHRVDQIYLSPLVHVAPGRLPYRKSILDQPSLEKSLTLVKG